MQAWEQEKSSLDNGIGGSLDSVSNTNSESDTRSSLNHTCLFTKNESQGSADFLQREFGIKITGGSHTQTSLSLLPKKSIEIAYGRKLEVEELNSISDSKTITKACHISFHALCIGPPFLSADDFNSICGAYPTIILHGLRVMTTEEHDCCKRLTNFIDCCYNHKIRLILMDVECNDVDSTVNDKTDTILPALFRHLIPLEYLSLTDLVRQEVEANMNNPTSKTSNSIKLCWSWA